jgi:hypothetical protein
MASRRPSPLGESAARSGARHRVRILHQPSVRVWSHGPRAGRPPTRAALLSAGWLYPRWTAKASAPRASASVTMSHASASSARSRLCEPARSTADRMVPGPSAAAEAHRALSTPAWPRPSSTARSRQALSRPGAARSSAPRAVAGPRRRSCAERWTVQSGRVPPGHLLVAGQDAGGGPGQVREDLLAEQGQGGMGLVGVGDALHHQGGVGGQGVGQLPTEAVEELRPAGGRAGVRPHQLERGRARLGPDAPRRRDQGGQEHARVAVLGAQPRPGDRPPAAPERRRQPLGQHVPDRSGEEGDASVCRVVEGRLLGERITVARDRQLRVERHACSHRARKHASRVRVLSGWARSLRVGRRRCAGTRSASCPPRGMSYWSDSG